MPLTPLPIDAMLPDILSVLEGEKNLILQATPGSGKTTRVPPALLNATWRKPDREILVLVPRRLAAKLAAFRVAEEMGERVGETVGYQFRFEKVMGAKTRLKFLTEGILLRRLLSEPTLPGVAAVVLDEFHERHLHSDIALAYLYGLQKTRRPDLRILIMSATLDTKPLSKYLGGAKVLELEARTFPIHNQYQSSAKEMRLEDKVARGVQQILSGDSQGDVLVFLPGMAEIRRAEERIAALNIPDVKLLPLHGELPREQQALVFQKFPRRKVILSTNVAESSLTIDGVTVVIDSGLHRQASFSWWSGVPALKTKPISQASAIQRAGRAGRTAPGLALRLYSQADFQGRPGFDLPEVQRADLAQTLLELKSLPGIHLETFPWFEAPPEASLQSAAELLYYLGATEARDLAAPLSAIGRRMVGFPVHPRLSRILVEAESRSVLDAAAALAARISEGELSELDALAALNQSESESVRRLHSTLVGAVREPPPGTDASKRKLSYHAPNPRTGAVREPPLHGNLAPGDRARGELARDELALCVLTGYPDRIAKKRPVTGLSKADRGSEVAREFDLVFSYGGSGTVPGIGPVPDHELFAILDVQERQALGQLRSKVHVRSLAAIEPEWLFALKPSMLEEREELSWDPAARRVWQISRLSYGSLVLEETRKAPLPSEAVEHLLLREGLGQDWEAEPKVQDFLELGKKIADAEAFETTLARLRLFQEHSPSTPFVSLDPKGLKILLIQILQGCTSMEDLTQLDLNERLLSQVPAELQNQFRQALPEHVTLPGGRRIKIHYSLTKPPWIASRLQDFFGMREAPNLLGGRLKLTLHLLAPNQRAVQVTQDLKNFWEKIYPELRPQLSRRYPRHSWPQDPLNAAHTATGKVQKTP